MPPIWDQPHGILRSRAKREAIRAGSLAKGVERLAAGQLAARRHKLVWFCLQDIVEKLTCAIRPCIGQRMGSCQFPRNVKRGEAGGTQIEIKDASAARANNIKRARHWQGGYRQPASKSLDEDHAKSIGPARKDEDIRGGVLNSESITRFCSKKMGIRIGRL